jgi:hypothetical protein
MHMRTRAARSGAEVLSLLAALPRAATAEHDEALDLVSEAKLRGKGLGWIGVNLPASALLTGCGLWTEDKTGRGSRGDRGGLVTGPHA